MDDYRPLRGVLELRFETWTRQIPSRVIYVPLQTSNGKLGCITLTEPRIWRPKYVVEGGRKSKSEIIGSKFRR